MLNFKNAIFIAFLVTIWSTNVMAKVTFLPNVSDDLGFSGSQGIDQDHNSGNSCGDFPLTSCPTGGICGRCSFGAFYKLNNCKSGFLRNGNSCVPGSCSGINASYKATIPTNNICTKTTTNGLTCFKDCRAISCSGYTLNCDAFNVANSASKDVCPDCNSADANCSPKLCKVGTCHAGYKLAENATHCVALDDTCSNGYFKTCETGTTGEPQYTELGTACYQCKAKPEPIPTAIGDILYSDLTTSPEIISEKTAIGIVFEPEKTLALALEGTTGKWAGLNYEVPFMTNYTTSSTVRQDWIGKENTRIIANYEETSGKSYPAAKYARGYSTEGTSPKNWYLPAFGEINQIYTNKDKVNEVLGLLGKDALSTSWYWTSSQSDFGGWRQYFTNGNEAGSSRTEIASILPIINYTNLEDSAPACKSAPTVPSAIGTIYYSDGTFTKEVDTCKIPVGIVVSKSGSNGLVMSLDEMGVTGWGGWGFEEACLDNRTSSTTALTDKNGVANTQCLSKCASLHTHGPAKYCINMKAAATGTGSSGWYLPAAGELALIRPNYTSINTTLGQIVDAKVVVAQKLSTKWYWASTEDDSKYAWSVQVSKSQNTNPGQKRDNWSPTRCFLAF